MSASQTFNMKRSKFCWCLWFNKPISCQNIAQISVFAVPLSWINLFLFLHSLMVANILDLCISTESKELNSLSGAYTSSVIVNTSSTAQRRICEWRILHWHVPAFECFWRCSTTMHTIRCTKMYGCTRFQADTAWCPLLHVSEHHLFVVPWGTSSYLTKRAQISRQVALLFIALTAILI